MKNIVITGEFGGMGYATTKRMIIIKWTKEKQDFSILTGILMAMIS